MTWSDSATPLEGAERMAYVTLALTPGIGPERLRSLLAACGTANGVLGAPFEFLCAVPGMSRAGATAIMQAKPDVAQEVVRQTLGLGGVVLLPGDAAYPHDLLTVDPSPTVLFANGNLALLQGPMVAIVGSRDHTRYGAEVCGQVASRAAAAGLTVVSGMARGLDAIAHEATLQVGGATIGVLGNGLGVIYPAANRQLYQQVQASGLLLTEFPPGERPTAGSFPRRNRLISGLAKVTVVIEAAIGSGALITANEAMEQGKDVMAVPGPITGAKSAGTNRLIRDGAMPLLEMDDLFARFPELVRSRNRETPVSGVEATPQGHLLALLREGTLHVDELARRLGLRASELLGLLATMEIAGLVRQEPGMIFALAQPWFATDDR